MLAALTSNLDLWPPTSSTGPNFRSSSSPRKCVGWKIVFLFPLSFPLCAVLYTNSSETLKVTNHGGKLGAASNGNSHISWTINYHLPSTINYQLLNIITRPTFLSRPIFPFNVPRSPWGSDSISLFLDIYLPVDQPFHRSNDLEEKGPITNYCQWLNTSFGRLCGISKLSQRSKKKH